MVFLEAMTAYFMPRQAISFYPKRIFVWFLIICIIGWVGSYWENKVQATRLVPVRASVGMLFSA